MRSSWNLPRKNSLPKLGLVHSSSRAASATCRASFSVTVLMMGTSLTRSFAHLVTTPAGVLKGSLYREFTTTETAHGGRGCTEHGRTYDRVPVLLCRRLHHGFQAVDRGREAGGLSPTTR